MQTLATAAAALAGVGMLQAGLGLAAVQRFAAHRGSRPYVRQPVTVLKPLHGDEPLLERALASFFVQEYPVFQLVFGVQDRADPALAVLDRLRARFPHVPVSVVVDPTPHGANRKVANLINMLPEARHDVLVIADSDMHVAPDYLDRLAAALAQPGAGLVTTLYSGLPAEDTLPARLGTSYINHAFLPGALLARALGRQDCLGATMALTRGTLQLVGGLQALANHLADDAVLGRLVLAHGMRVVLAGTVPATTVPEAQLPTLFQHELRWARTIKALVPIEFALSAIQFPLFWAALAVGLSGAAQWTVAVFAIAWLLRGVFGLGVDRALGLAPAAPFWLLPLRDTMSVTVILASYRTRQVSWRGQVLRATAPHMLTGKG